MVNRKKSTQEQARKTEDKDSEEKRREKLKSGKLGRFLCRYDQEKTKPVGLGSERGAARFFSESGTEKRLHQKNQLYRLKLKTKEATDHSRS